MKDISLPIFIKNKRGNVFTLYTLSGQWCKTVIIDEIQGLYSICTSHLVKYTKDESEDSRKGKLNLYCKRILWDCQEREEITFEEFIEKVNYVEEKNKTWCKESTGDGGIIYFEKDENEYNVDDFLKYSKHEKKISSNIFSNKPDTPF